MEYTKEWLQHTDIYDYIVENEQGKLHETIQRVAEIIDTEIGLDRFTRIGQTIATIDVGAPSQPLTLLNDYLNITMGIDNMGALKSGMIVRVNQRIKEKNSKGEDRERIQVFEGQILSIKHGQESGATATVRKVSGGIGVEKIFPLHSPIIESIEIVREMKVRQSRPNYLRTYKKKLKEIKRPKAEKKATK